MSKSLSLVILVLTCGLYWNFQWFMINGVEIHKLFQDMGAEGSNDSEQGLESPQLTWPPELRSRGWALVPHLHTEDHTGTSRVVGIKSFNPPCTVPG